MKVIWREWYNEKAIKQLTEMNTLPRYEFECDENPGWYVAAKIAKAEYENNGNSMNHGDVITIIEPASIAGDYDIAVEMEPNFYASKRAA